MSKSIVVTLPHALGVAEAKKRISERIAALRSDYVDKIGHSEVAWTGDRADLRVVALGQSATGTIDVMSDALRIEVQLPWMLAALSGRLEGLLTHQAKDTLLIGAKPKS